MRNSLKPRAVAAVIAVVCGTALFLPSAVRAYDAVDIGFSPDGTGQRLVLRAINSAQRTVRLAAYSFTAVPVVRALVDAKKRGVDVAVVVDFKSNLQEDRSGRARAALNVLVNAGVTTLTVSAYPIQHSKYCVVDGLHVETGSYNYSAAAATANSENVVVLWNRPDLAAVYLANWQELASRAQPYASSY